MEAHSSYSKPFQWIRPKAGVPLETCGRRVITRDCPQTVLRVGWMGFQAKQQQIPG